MKIVNICAERGIALIQKFDSTISKNGEKKICLTCRPSSMKELFGGIKIEYPDNVICK